MTTYLRYINPFQRYRGALIMTALCTIFYVLFNALSLDAGSLTLIALWDQGKADGPGGTEDLVFQVQSRGHKLLRPPAEELKLLDTD